jgi:SRSO17 transposase
MVDLLLMELEDYNCWSIAEAVGYRGPHRLQHLLSRAVWDDQQVLDAAAAWAVAQLDDGDAVLIVDETADEKSCADAVGAARQYCGTVGGIALCQVAVTLTFATSRGHTLIDRALYLPEACAADEEHRELAGVPEEVMFATKPELAGALLQRAHERGICAPFVAGDEVYGGRGMREAIRGLGMGYVLAVRANHTLTTGPGQTLTAAGAVKLIPRNAWQRMRTGHGTKGSRHYDWAMLEVTSDDAPGGHHGKHDAGHSVLLIRRHRYTGTCSFYRCWTPRSVPLTRLIAIAVTRWRIGRRSPARQAGRRPGRGPGDPLEILASMERPVPARLHLPGRDRRLTPRQPCRPRDRPDPRHHSRARAAATRHRHPAASPRQNPPPALVTMATPPPIPRSPGPSALEHLRRCTMITTIYSRRIRAAGCRARSITTGDH